MSAVLMTASLLMAFATGAMAGKWEDQVIATHDARLQAMIDEDIDALSPLLADDLHYSHATGSVESKAGFLSTIASRRVDYLAAKGRDFEVRLIGDVAVVTGLSDMKLIFGGEQHEFTIRFLEVCHKVDKAWQLVAWQSVRFDGGAAGADKR